MMNRSFYACLLGGAALALSACVGPDANLDRGMGPMPLSRYVLQVEPDQDRIALAVHQNGLSLNQRQAIMALAQRYRGSNQTGLVIQVPTDGEQMANQTASQIASTLENVGVPRAQISVEGYRAPSANAPVLAGFTTIRAAVPRCGAEWGNLGRTGNNDGASNFGCAVNANLAAQIADPNDIVAPRTMTPPSAQRRTVVFEAYRQGQATSAQREQLLSESRVSDVVE
ncbi:CpaD family pilus assembly protein [Brevundimonas sp. GN22]